MSVAGRCEDCLGKGHKKGNKIILISCSWEGWFTPALLVRRVISLPSQGG